MLSRSAGEVAVVRLEAVVMILDLHRQGLTVSDIARQSGLDRKTVRRYIERGLEPPTYGPRKPRRTVLDPFTTYLRERVAAYPSLTGARLRRELKELGYSGGYTAVTDFLRDVRPRSVPGFEVRFETAPGGDWTGRRWGRSCSPTSRRRRRSSGCSRWCSATAA